MQDVSIAVLVPCYNEILTIRHVIEDFLNCVPDAVIYVYDNNSTDGSYEAAKAYESGGRVCVGKCLKQGKGNVVKQMLSEIDADVYLMVDADSTYHANDAAKLIDGILNQKYDMMLGDRLENSYETTNVRPFHGFGNWLVKTMVNILYHGHISDVMTGYRAFTKQYAKHIDIKSGGFEIETEMCVFALKHGYKIGQAPILYTDRPDGSKSKLNTISDGIKVMLTIFKLKF